MSIKVNRRFVVTRLGLMEIFGKSRGKIGTPGFAVQLLLVGFEQTPWLADWDRCGKITSTTVRHDAMSRKLLIVKELKIKIIAI